MAEEASVTMLLRAWRDGDAAALDKVMPLVYQELHRLASRHLRDERPGHTFRPTDLVSEAYLRLISTAPPQQMGDRVHFFAVAARNMRQILIDHARRRTASKRGVDPKRITLDDGLATSERHTDVIALDEALQQLAVIDKRKAHAVELHYFGGLTQEEIALVQNVHVNTVARDLRLAAAWLHSQMQDAH